MTTERHEHMRVRVERGNPTEPELAALTAVLCVHAARTAEHATDDGARPVTAGWCLPALRAAHSWQSRGAARIPGVRG